MGSARDCGLRGKSRGNNAADVLPRAASLLGLLLVLHVVGRANARDQEQRVAIPVATGEAAGEGSAQPPDAFEGLVREITEDELEAAVRGSEYTFLTLYRRTDHGSDSYLSMLQGAAEALASNGFAFARMDASGDAERAIAERFNVDRFPQSVLFRDRDPSKGEVYVGPTQLAEDMVASLRRLKGPPSQELQGQEEIEGILAAEGAMVVGVFVEYSVPEYATFSNVARKLQGDFVFRHTQDVDLLPGEFPTPRKLPVVRVLQHFDHGYADLDDLSSGDELEEFILGETLPTVVQYDGQPSSINFMRRINDMEGIKVYVFVPDKSEDHTDLRFSLQDTAEKAPDSVAGFFFGDASEGAAALHHFGLSVDDTPCIIANDLQLDRVWLRRAIQPADVEDFVNSVLEGSEPRQPKSGPMPESNDGPVRELVGRTFDDVVFRSGKHVLLEFYGSWCGVCTSVEPIYSGVGELYLADPEILVARVELSRNEFPTDKFSVPSIPSIFFCSRTGEIIPYTETITKLNLIYFVEKLRRDFALQDDHMRADKSEEKPVSAKPSLGKDEL